MKKHASLLIVFGIALLLVTVVGATFAYFANGSINSENKTDINANVAGALNISLYTIGDSLSLSVPSVSMLPANITNEAVAEDNGTLEVRLTAGNENIAVECEYDIYYVYDNASDVYSRSDNNSLEFTYKINKNDTLYKRETNYINKTSVPQKIGTGVIRSNGTETIDTYSISSKFYNLDVNQSSNADSSFKIKFYIDTNENRCTKSGGYTGYVYRMNDNYADKKMLLTNTSGTRWVMAYSSMEFFNYEDRNTCVERLEALSSSYLYGAAYYVMDDVPENFDGFYCKESAGEFEGIGDYYTNRDDLANVTYDFYCIMNEGENECAEDIGSFTVRNLYRELSECESDINYDTQRCEHLVMPSDPLYYLKHEVVGGVITDTETCLYLNNREFCMGPNYRVDGDEDGSLTAAKLKMEIESAIGLEFSCSSNSDPLFEDYISCTYGNARCFVENNDSVCMAYHDGACRVTEAGASGCQDL